MRLIQVVPRIGPWDGVGDYAVRLAESMVERHGVSSTFIEAGERQSGAEASKLPFEVRGCTRREFTTTLAKAGAGDAGVLLHYVGYGYAARGAPLWLARAIARTRRDLGFRLGVVFHELYATGPPWNSSFWLSELQKHVTRRLATECDYAVLTREESLKWLQGAGSLAGKVARVLPMASTVGEPVDSIPVSERPGVMVVWGSAVMKQAVYGRCWPAVVSACRDRGISQVVDVGEPFAGQPRTDEVEVQARGRLPAPELSGILKRARLGLVVYPASFLAKSTLFAAYAAHGVVPLVVDARGTIAMDGLAAGRHFLPLAGRASGFALSLDEIAASLRAWYSGHTAAAHADAVWRMLAVTAP
jgi:hypothetical protein